MADVNYIVERETFVRHARDNSYSANEQLLWYALFTIFNERARRNGGVWSDGFIRISNKELLSWLPFSENTLIAVRGEMVNPSKHNPTLFEYLKGKKNVEAPQYKMNYFSTSDRDASSDDDCYLNIMGNNGGNMRGNVEGNNGGNMRGNVGDINVKLNMGLNVTPRTNDHTQPIPTTAVSTGAYRAREGSYTRLDGTDGENRFDASFMSSPRARGAIAQRLIDGFGGDVDSDETHALLCSMMKVGFPPELIEDCMDVCQTTGELESKLQTLFILRGYDGEDDRRDLARCRRVAGGNEKFAQVLYRMGKTGSDDDADED